MKLFRFLLQAKKKRQYRARADYYQDSLNRAGREQFRRLKEKGLSIPVVVL